MPTDPEKTVYVRRMFANISDTYDRLNNILSFGCDQYWRHVTAAKCAPAAGGKILDVAAGTGRLARTLAGKYPANEVIGVDFSPEMLAMGQRRLQKENNRHRIRLALGDATCLPFKDNDFTAVTLAYALRNIPDLNGALREALRVLEPGGRFIALELTRPGCKLLKWPFRFYLGTVIPFIGGVISGKKHAYDYLGDSIRSFQEPDEFAAMMRSAGFGGVSVYRLTFGAATVWVGLKPK
jgi:demethylmenaquinone methyltransferase / 2-methoxy-6-polyprenyl-1,4-benzoquinol methylase